MVSQRAHNEHSMNSQWSLQGSMVALGLSTNAQRSPLISVKFAENQIFGPSMVPQGSPECFHRDNILRGLGDC